MSVAFVIFSGPSITLAGVTVPIVVPVVTGEVLAFQRHKHIRTGCASGNRGRFPRHRAVYPYFRRIFPHAQASDSFLPLQFVRYVPSHDSGTTPYLPE